MTKKNILISISLGILVFILLFGGFAAVQFFKKPQAQTLNLVLAPKIVVTSSNTITPSVQLTPTSQKKMSEEAKPATPTATQITVAKVAPTLVPPVCGQTGAWTILVLGRSTRIEHEGTQIIRLVKVDFAQKNVLVYTFPPHLLLDTPSLVADYSIHSSQMEEIFSRVEKAIKERDEADFKATQAVAQVILDTFGVPVDFYTVIRDDIVMESVDALGGIYVNLPVDFTMPENTSRKGELIKAGIQLFDGEMLFAYVSTVSKDEDEFDRLTRQNAVLEGMRKKMLNPSTLLKIIQLYSIYKEYVVTDLSLEQMTSLGCLARLVSRDQIVMKEPSMEEVVYLEGESMKFKDLASTVRQLQTLFGLP